MSSSNSILKTGLAIVGVTVLSATAVTAATVGNSAGPVYPYCIHSGSTCAYPDGSYWDNCDPRLPEGYILTSSARMACESFVGK